MCVCVCVCLRVRASERVSKCKCIRSRASTYHPRPQCFSLLAGLILLFISCLMSKSVEWVDLLCDAHHLTSIRQTHPSQTLPALSTTTILVVIVQPFNSANKLTADTRNLRQDRITVQLNGVIPRLGKVEGQAGAKPDGPLG